MTVRNECRTSRFSSGLTLVEVLVAVCMASVVLVAAWPWCWETVSESRRATERANTESALAFAVRLFTSEARRAGGIGNAAGEGCSTSSVVLRLEVTAGVTEEVAYRYDALRGVLWRKSPGSYVAEGLRSCRLSYFRADGSEVLPRADGTLAGADLPSVCRVDLHLVAASPDQDLERCCVVALRVSGR